MSETAAPDDDATWRPKIVTVLMVPVALYAARLALFAAVVYVIASVVGLVSGRRWLSEIGPFKAAHPLEQLEHAETQVRGELADAVRTINSLEERVAAGESEFRDAKSAVADLIDYASRLQGERGETT